MLKSGGGSFMYSILEKYNNISILVLSKSVSWHHGMIGFAPDIF